MKGNYKMKKVLVGIFDEKLDDIIEMYFRDTEGMAIREFSDMTNSEKTPIYKHPEDYKLVKIAEFDTSTTKDYEVLSKGVNVKNENKTNS